MNNFERIKSLSQEELAWVLLNNVTSGDNHGCPCCIYKDWEKCKEIADEIRVSCIEGHRRWLDRQSTEEDKHIFAIAKNNVLVDQYNSMSNEEKLKYRLIYRDGLIVGIEKVKE
jgi:hypothetical protein